jgi:hypothetical protein
MRKWKHGIIHMEMNFIDDPSFAKLSQALSPGEFVEFSRVGK